MATKRKIELNRGLRPWAFFAFSALALIVSVTIHYLLPSQDSLSPKITLILALIIPTWFYFWYIIKHLDEQYVLLPYSPSQIPVAIKIAEIIQELDDKLEKENELAQTTLRNVLFEEIERIGDPPTPGRVSYQAEALDGFYDALISSMSAKYEIWATCYSDMDEFWFKPEVGGEYLKFNLRLSVEKGVAVKRLFVVAAPGSLDYEIRKGQLINILSAVGVSETKIIPRLDSIKIMQSAGLSANRDDDPDMFLIVDKSSGNPLLGLEWDLNLRGGVNKVHIIYEQEHLLSMSNLFERFWESPLSREVIIPSSEILVNRMGIDQSIQIWNNLVNFSSTNNQVRYLQIDEDVPAQVDEIREYWSNLVGTFVRPTKQGTAYFRQRLEEISKKIGSMRHVAVLGCTPEVRIELTRCLKPSAEVETVDLSRGMRRAMDAVVRREIGESPQDFDLKNRVLEHTLRVFDWLIMYEQNAIGANKKYDLIAGVDVLNMIDHKDVDKLLKSIHDCLSGGRRPGFFLTQVVVEPVGRYADILGNVGTDLAPSYVKLMDQMGDDRKHISDGEMLTRLCFSQRQQKGNATICNTGDVVNNIGTIEYVLDAAGRQSRNLYKKYKFLNSVLHIYRQDDLEQKFTDAGFRIIDSFNEAERFPNSEAANGYPNLFRWFVLEAL